MKTPIEIGITGGIGSGKSYIATIFSHLGVPVYNSDIRAKELVNSSDELKSKIIALLGAEVYKDGVYQSKVVSSKVFNDNKLLTALNNIIHPAVRNDYTFWVSGHIGKHYVLKESALIFELNLHKTLDKVILVTSSTETKLNRIATRDTWRSEKEIKNIISKQLSDIEKVAKSDFVIDNNNALVLPQIIKIHSNILKLNTS